jgi:hypothetical protein
VVVFSSSFINHGATENTEVAQEKRRLSTFRAKPLDPETWHWSTQGVVKEKSILVVVDLSAFTFSSRICIFVSWANAEVAVSATKQKMMALINFTVVSPLINQKH